MMKGNWRIDEVKRYRVNETDFETREDAIYELHRVGFECWYNGPFATAQSKPSDVSHIEIFRFIIDNSSEIADRIDKYKKDMEECDGNDTS